MKIYEYIVRIKDQASDKLRRLGSGISTGTRGVDRFNDSLKNAEGSTLTLGRATSSLARWIGPAVLGAALVAGAAKASTLGRELEQTRISFEVMVGSAKEGQALLKDVTELANITPFTGRDLQGSTKLLLNFGVAANKVIPTLKMLGDISGGDANRLHFLTLAFSQTQAAGRLMGQDLLQMVNAGFNPLQEISRKTGISIGKLKEKMEDGAISAKMVEAAFKGATEHGGRFFGMMDKQSQTFEGRLSTLKDKMELLASGVGEGINTFLSPILDSALNKLDAIVDKAGKMKQDASKQRDKFQNLQTNILPTIDRFKDLTNNQNTDSLKKVLGLDKKAKDFEVTTAKAKELNKMIQEIGRSIPLAVEKWDAMGNATKINVIEAKRYIAEQERLFKSQNEGAQTGVEEKIKELNMRKADIDKTIKAVKARELGTSDNDKFVGTGFTELSKLAQEKLALESQLSELRNDRIQAYLKTDGKGTGIDPFADLNKDKKKKNKDGLDKITGGGKQAVNVTINLENLVGVQKFDVKNIKETVQDMGKATVEELLRVLNSANYAMNQ